MGRDIEIVRARIPALTWIDNASRKSIMSQTTPLNITYRTIWIHLSLSTLHYQSL
jgi:hypothetical protein